MPRGDGQSQARAGVLGGEKRIEQPLFDFGRNAFAGVGHFQDDDVGLAVGQWFPVRRARKVIVPSWPMLSAAFCTRLIKTCLICAGSTWTRMGADASRPVEYCFWPIAEPKTVASIKADRPEMVTSFGSGGTGELEELGHDPLQAQDFPFHHRRVGAFRASRARIFSAG